MHRIRRTTLGIFLVVGVSIGCAKDLDTTRTVDPRGTVGEEVYGIFCDRLAAQTIREDLTGASFAHVCHKDSGSYADDIDSSKLPGTHPDVSRLKALVRHRANFIAAIDASFPEGDVPIVDSKNGDPLKSCNATGTRALSKELADLLGRFGPLYKDGTMPRSTESMTRLFDAFRGSKDAKSALVRMNAREGYRPREIALGMVRPILAYPRLRELAAETLRLLSPDADPFNPNPRRLADGTRVPIPGPGYEPFARLMDALHLELKTATVEDSKPLVVTRDLKVVRDSLSRPRTNLEFARGLLFSQDAGFGTGPSQYVVSRDRRGFAAVTLSGGSVPAPFMDKDGDKLPDVDLSTGVFLTTNGAPPPTPFLTYDPTTASVARDSSGRAEPGGSLLYSYLDANHTFLSKLVVDTKSLVDSDITHNHETLMGTLGGIHLLLGDRVEASKQYSTGEALTYPGYDPNTSAVLDLVHALFQIIGARSIDENASVISALLTNNERTVAQVTKAMLDFKAISDKHPEAKNAHNPTSTFGDEVFDVLTQIAQEPGLLEDVIRSLGDDRSIGLATGFGAYMKFGDRISYDRNDLNGAVTNLTTGKRENMRTVVDRSKPDSGFTRSAFGRLMQTVHDEHHVTQCNQANAKMHAKLGPISITLPLTGGFKECEVFKIEDLARFYLRSIVGKSELYLRPDSVRNGIAGIGAASVDVVQSSSGLTGFWDGTSSHTLRPKPSWLNRVSFFDLTNDSYNSGPNHQTNVYLRDLNGVNIGTQVCPERLINDPVPNAPDAAADGIVHGLRSCADGDWLNQRDPDAAFVWEQFGFYDAMTPTINAFVAHNKDDLILDLMEVFYRHWQNDTGSANECDPKNKTNSKYCTQDGLSSYEQLISEALTPAMLTSLHDFENVLETISVPRCTAFNATTKQCTTTTLVNGVTAIAELTRSLFDPKLNAGLKDRQGNSFGLRNDGTKNPQVTPIYLLANALNEFDAAFAAAEKADPVEGGARHLKWLSSRSQIVDLFMTVTGTGSSMAFANPGLPKATPKLLDLLRAQLVANCPTSFSPPYDPCPWTRTQLTDKWTKAMQGPTFAAAMDLVEAIRSSDPSRRELEAVLEYLSNAASTNDALSSMIASSSDLLQVFENDADMVPLMNVIGEGLAGSKRDADGRILSSSVTEAQLSLLSRIALRAYDDGGHELCSKEIDPNQVLNVALKNLIAEVTIDGKKTTPVDEILDTIGDINRVDPSLSGKLDAEDLNSVADRVGSFMSDEKSGLEQLYAIMRQGVE